MKKYIAAIAAAAVMIALTPKLFGLVFGSSLPAKGQKEFTLTLTESGSVITLSAEDYLTGCLFAQINVSYEEEALKAQAAAAYTYALRLCADGAELSDSTALCQPYFTPAKAKEYYGDSYEKYLPKVREAAEYGAGHAIYYENKPIYSVYCSVSAGASAHPDYIWDLSLPYLARAECPKDLEYKDFLAENEMTADMVRQRLLQYDPAIEMPLDYSLWFSDAVRDEYGYVISVKAGGKTLNGGDLWRILKLRSTAFEIVWNKVSFTIITKGYGHGAGMSQYTANEMAKEGKKAEEILEHFYKGTEIKKT
ncbi:MAG: SpoIID/LytB domain-containing protein [Bacteroides sp.]|nr:SpoIID/LytB domain-containing protein [Bacteroides sp.]